MRAPFLHARPARFAVVCVMALLTVVFVGPISGAEKSGPQAGGGAVAAQQTDDEESERPVPTPSGIGDGRLAYVTPQGSVVVTDVDGSDPVTVGGGAATNSVGLAPLAWRQPAADAITYVREDRSLVVAPLDGSPEQIVARDAVVPDYSDEKSISWQLDGSFLVYLAETSPGRVESRVIDFSEADTDTPPSIRTIGNPNRRIVLGQQFAPLDPFIYQRTVDNETGEEFTVAIVEPVNGAIFGTPFSLDDPTFSPDGRYLVAVVTASSGNQQLVRIPMTSPRVELMADHDRVCSPAVSADGNSVVYAAGPNCEEVWTIDINAANRTRILERAGANSTFEVGQFSWSPDGGTVSHAACANGSGETFCDGGYWNISTEGDGAEQQARAGSVLREQVALLRPVSFEVHLDGGVAYDGEFLIGSEGTSLLEADDSELVEATAADQNDPDRKVEVKLFQGKDALYLSGTMRVIDGTFDETVVFFGRAQPLSYGFAQIRGIWIKSESMPIRSGQLLITISR